MTADEDALSNLTPGQQAIAWTDSMTDAVAALPRASLENLLVVSVGTDPAAVEHTVRDRNADPGRVGVVPVAGTPVDYDGPLWTARTVQPNDLTGLSIEIARGMQHLRAGEGWLLVDSLSVLLMYADADRVSNLVRSVTERCRERETTGVYAMARGAVGETTREEFRSLFDRESDVR